MVGGKCCVQAPMPLTCPGCPSTVYHATLGKTLRIIPQQLIKLHVPGRARSGMLAHYLQPAPLSTLCSPIRDSLKHPALLLVVTLHLFQFWPLLLCSFSETSTHSALLSKGGLGFSSSLWSVLRCLNVAEWSPRMEEE